ncbi:MAG TPA: (4Fe-4S)-binding protein [Desulfobacteraceae bacterium]|nr:(4Fe-4S)-binding protein [Desulfobacteraceae bacterium]
MILSIASGKGGTGKTTIATNLAWILGSKAQLLDCDVEEPNSQLFINAPLGEPETVTIPVPKVDEDICTLCRECSDLCQFKAIVVIGETILTFPELCHSCGGCWEVCPVNAISQTERELGVIEEGSIEGLDFAHGRLRVGEAMAPPLIKAVRDRMGKREVIIIDAPPGTSCPVIAAMKNTDFVLLVTEPTPFGLNDLKLAVGAVRALGIPCGLVINRSDLGDQKVIEYATAEQIPILMEIPFDRKIAEAYSRGDLVVKVIPEWRKKFEALYLDILKLAGKEA